MAFPFLLSARLILRSGRLSLKVRRLRAFRRYYDSGEFGRNQFPGLGQEKLARDADLERIDSVNRIIRRNIREQVTEGLSESASYAAIQRLFRREQKEADRLLGPGAFKIRAKFRDATPTLRGIRRDQQEAIGDEVVAKMRSPKWWPIGPARGRLRYPIRSGLRFRYSRSGNQVRFDNPAPYWRKVNEQGNYLNRAVNATVQERDLRRQFGRILRQGFSKLR